MSVDTFRNMRLSPEAVKDLADLRAHLLGGVQLKQYAPANAWNAYNDALRQTLQNPACFVVDDRDWYPVKCRSCGHVSSVLKDVDFWDCMGCGSKKRTAFLDLVNADGTYRTDLETVIEKDRDVSHVRAKALADGATLTEAAEEAERAKREAVKPAR